MVAKGELLADADERKEALLENGVDADDGVGLAHERKHRLSEARFVCPQHPADEDGGKGVEAHEGRIDGPILRHGAGIHHNKAGYRLQGHQGGGRQLPGIVT